MIQDPLAPPANPQVLQTFLARSGLSAGRDAKTLLVRIARCFSRLPYENLTKIIKEHETSRPIEARRAPHEVLDDHFRFGSGGTCFSLTATLLHLVRSLGLRAEPILADRRYGKDTHCAILVWHGGLPHLIDPGYLILEPIVLPTSNPLVVATAFNQLIFEPRDGGAKVELSTQPHSGGQKTFRLTFKTAPADPGEFLHAWDSSFDWEMMRYPVLTRVDGESQLFLRGNRLQVRLHDRLQLAEIPPEELTLKIASDFGIHADLVRKALAIIEDKGENLG